LFSNIDDLLLASRHVTSLNSIRNMYIADNGELGEANFKKGKSAEHLIVQVN
jgi:GTPase involved in cell partitioning and DNA repair